jgi:hypothetical protein
MTTCSDDQYRDFGRDTDHNLRRARVAGYVLLAGLFLEVVSYIFWFHGIETLASMVCVALVAGGVAGEIFFEYRARLADNGTPNVTAPPISRVQHPQPDYSYSGGSVNTLAIETRRCRQTARSYRRHFLNELAETCHHAANESALR